MKFKKSLRFIGIIIFVFIIGGLGSIFFNFYLLPKMSANPFFSRYKIFRKASENTTVITKTEQVVVKEDQPVNEIASQAATTVVNIISVSQNNTVSAKEEPQKVTKVGIGFIATNDGLIVTYRDAILEKDASYKILIFNGSNFDAKLIGIDEFTNLAYLKADASNLPAISFADSDDFRAGRKVIAIGSFSGEYQSRFATGLLSNVDKTFNLGGKSLSASEKLEGVFESDFISQDDYLGGPVISYQGELVGVIGAITLDNQKKYFEIPSNVVKKSMELAMKNELGSRPYLGIYYVPITKAYALANDLGRDRGALVYSSSGKQGLAIIAGSPAEKAGLEIFDVIIAAGGQEINLDNPLSNALSQYKKGDTIELLVLRNGQEIKVPVSL